MTIHHQLKYIGCDVGYQPETNDNHNCTDSKMSIKEDQELELLVPATMGINHQEKEVQTDVHMVDDNDYWPWPFMPHLPDELCTQRSQEGLQMRYRKQMKTLDKWNGRDNCAKMIGNFVIAATMVGAAVVSVIAGIQVSPSLSYVAAGLAAFGALKDPLWNLLITDITTKRRTKEMEKCRIMRRGLYEMYQQYMIAREDGEIDLNEILAFQKCINDMHDELFHVENEMLAEHIGVPRGANLSLVRAPLKKSAKIEPTETDEAEAEIGTGGSHEGAKDKKGGEPRC